jgi:hypothetical protein
LSGQCHTGQWIKTTDLQHRVSIPWEEEVKKVISVSLGASKDDYAFETEFLGQQFHVQRIGTDGSREQAAQKLLEYDKQADAIGIGSIQFPQTIKSNFLSRNQEDSIKTLGRKIQTPVTTGVALRDVSFEWALRFVDHKNKDYFKNAKVLFLSGMANYPMARVMAEFTDNMTFADPLIENGISKFIHSLKGFERYAKGTHEVLDWLPGKRLTQSVVPIKKWNNYISKKGHAESHNYCGPQSYRFHDYLKRHVHRRTGG